MRGLCVLAVVLGVVEVQCKPKPFFFGDFSLDINIGLTDEGLTLEHESTISNSDKSETYSEDTAYNNFENGTNKYESGSEKKSYEKDESDYNQKMSGKITLGAGGLSISHNNSILAEKTNIDFETNKIFTKAQSENGTRDTYSASDKYDALTNTYTEDSTHQLKLGAGGFTIKSNTDKTYNIDKLASESGGTKTVETDNSGDGREKIDESSYNNVNTSSLHSEESLEKENSYKPDELDSDESEA